MRAIVSILMLSFAFLSCSKEVKQEQDVSDFLGCHSRLAVDSLGTLVKLQGTWHLKRTNCHPGSEWRNTDEQFYVRFKNSNFEIVEKGKVLSRGRFELLESIEQKGKYLLKPQVIDNGKTGFISGSIYFCGNEMMLSFDGLDVEGCNYYYEQR